MDDAGGIADADALDVWEYATTRTGEDNSPQGFVGTVAGAGEEGYHDGAALTDLFANPQDVAVDELTHDIYVADTDNHQIRKIDTDTKQVSTVTGDGQEGFTDGPAVAASFSFPSGIAVYRRANDNLVIYVADTGNHRI